MKRTHRLARPRPAGPSGQSRAEPAVAALEIAEIGVRGDGLAAAAGGPIYVPFALPGERVRARIVGERGEIVSLERESAERTTPDCAHFGRCGGCQLQHWAEAPYLAWKREQADKALARRGLDIRAEPVIPAWGAGRRRAAFHATRAGGRTAFGFAARSAARIEPVTACPVLAPALAAVLPALRALAEIFTPERGEITLQCLATDAGVDCDIKGARVPGRAGLEAAAAASAPLARLSLNGEPLAMRARPVVRMGPAAVTPPPGAFLQPTALGEETLVALALDALGAASRVADLFCGLGAFSLRIAA
ncbi:MAG: RNA methyltransferase, partial [Hyphomonadaceae bacterium]